MFSEPLGPPKNIVFYISAVSSIVLKKKAGNCRNVKNVNSNLHMLKNVLEIADMLKC